MHTLFAPQKAGAPQKVGFQFLLIIFFLLMGIVTLIAKKVGRQVWASNHMNDWTY